MTREDYMMVDRFRPLAALMVIAIHISPLAWLSSAADFWLCRVFCRVAVPFFLMATGFFLFRREVSLRRVQRFTARIAAIYGVSVLLYLPVLIWQGYFGQEHLFLHILRDIFAEGFMYHLWYFPALILGIWVVYGLRRILPRGGVVAVCAALYVLGLLGDSYYGLAVLLPGAEAFYRVVFAVFGYSRNGLFMMPLFLCLGGLLTKKLPGRGISCVAAGASLLFMSGEAFLLRYLDWQRHDSMYLFLVPCVFFLMSFLLSFRGYRQRDLGRVALVVYVLHPMVIIAERGMSHLLGADAILIENGAVQYAIVALLTFALAQLLVFCASMALGGPVRRGMRVWAEVDLGAIRHNARVLRDKLPQGCHMMGVIKADAYGHGAVRVARALRREGVKSFAVATLDEGIELRRHGIRGEILILGWTDPARARSIWLHRLSQTVTDADYALELSHKGLPVRCHLAVDTGMHRIGIGVKYPEMAAVIAEDRPLRIEGVFSHLCCTENEAFTHLQMERFAAFLAKCEELGVHFRKKHLWNSGAILSYNDSEGYDYARAGISLFGVGDAALLPTYALRARVVQLRELEAGERLGYGLAGEVTRKSLIANVSIGYGDGLFRMAGKEGRDVIIRGKRCPMIGRVCMDQLSVDVTDCPGVTVGDVVTLIGSDGGETITLGEAAQFCGTIEHEVLCMIGKRVKRVYKKGVVK